MNSKTTVTTILLTSLIGFGAISEAQSISEYLALRKQNAITRPTSAKFLDELVGSRVLELQCRVKGTMDFDGRSSIYVEYLTGGEQVVEASAVPDWLKGNSIPARLIIRATRMEEFGPLRLEFVAAANESEVARYDAKPVAAPATPKPATSKTSTSQPARGKETSRGSSKVRTAAKNSVVPVYASFIKNHNRRLSEAQAWEIAESIIGWSLHFNVDARLVVALVIAESDFKINEVSHAKAMGLGQLIPEIQDEMGVKNPFDINENIYGTVRLLKRLLDRYNVTENNLSNLKLALAGYNAGPGAVKKYGGVPPYKETQNYVRRITALYDRLRGIR